VTFRERLIDYSADAPALGIVDKPFACQLVDRDRRLSGQPVIPGYDDRERNRCQRQDVDVRGCLARDRYEGRIQTVLLNGAQQLAGAARLHSYIELNLGPLLAEGKEQVGQWGEGERLEDPEPHGAAYPALNVGHRILRLVKGMEDLARLGEQDLSGLSEDDRVPGALEQLGVQGAFEGAHRCGQCRLGQRDLPCRASETQLLGNGYEMAKLAKLQHGEPTLGMAVHRRKGADGDVSTVRSRHGHAYRAWQDWWGFRHCCHQRGPPDWDACEQY
jgi:hypothetical protein